MQLLAIKIFVLIFVPTFYEGIAFSYAQLLSSEGTKDIANNNSYYRNKHYQPLNVQIQTDQISRENNKVQPKHSQTYRVSQRMSGGSVAKLAEFPYQVRINFTTTGDICGGAIISPLLILTAAHCFFNNKYEAVIESYGIEVTAGIQNLDIEENTKQTRQVLKIIAHEAYDYFNYTNDIALLGLNTAFKFNEFVNKIDYPMYSVKYTGMATISGWGMTPYSYPDLTTTLQKVEVPIVPIAKCVEQYKKANVQLPINKVSQLCAGTQKKDSCAGDSGGPLVCDSWKKKGEKVLCGITSFGSEKCGNAEVPGIYTDVSSFRFWITKSVKQFLEHRELIELILKEKHNANMSIKLKMTRGWLHKMKGRISKLERHLRNKESL